MPLIIIALVLLIGLLIYFVIGLKTDSYDNRPVRERYPHVFKKNDLYEEDEESEDAPQGEDRKMLYFPTDNVEKEKHKRNIH